MKNSIMEKESQDDISNAHLYRIDFSLGAPYFLFPFILQIVSEISLEVKDFVFCYHLQRNNESCPKLARSLF